MRLRGGLSGVLLVALISVVSAPIAHADGGTLVCDDKGRCKVVADTSGTDPNRSLTGNGNGSGTGSGTTTPDPCKYAAAVPTPPAGDPRWGGEDSTKGVLYAMSCPDAINVMNQNLVYAFVRYVYSPTGTPPQAVVPDPLVVAQKAISELNIPEPAVSFGPDAAKIAANYWTYLWVNNAQQKIATATAGPVTVTATASLTSVLYSMGEPMSAADLSISSAPFTCQGAGVDPGTSVDVTVSPPAGSCAYMFHVRSTAARTNGLGSWPVTATATWTVVWTSNIGVGGTVTPPTRASTTQVRVGAWGTVIVANGSDGPTG